MCTTIALGGHSSFSIVCACGWVAGRIYIPTVCTYHKSDILLLISFILGEKREAI